MDYQYGQTKSAIRDLPGAQQAQYLPDSSNQVDTLPASPIAESVKRLEASREQLRAMVHELERKVSPVLRPVPPTAPSPGDTKSARAARSGMAEMLAAHTEQLQSICIHVGSLIDRVEL